MMNNKLTKLTFLIFMLVWAGTPASASVELKTMTIDFEKTAIADYRDEWNYSGFGLSSGIVAHGGTSYGKNNETTPAYLATKSKVNPLSLTCYVARKKESVNSSTWQIEVSKDGNSWTTVNSTSATDMAENTWKMFNADLSSYSDVYVRIYYSGSSQVKYIDDLTLTLKDFSVSISEACTDGTKYYGTFSAPFAFTVPEGVTVSEVGVDDGRLVVKDYAAAAVIPANTGVMISSTTAGEKTFIWATGGTSLLGEANRLRPTLSGINAETMGQNDENCLYYRLTMHNGETIGFWWGAENGAAFTMGANKAYLAVPNSSARQGFNLFGDNSSGIDDEVKLKASDHYFSLQGQRIGSPKKGLYIVNGKKVVVK